MMSAGEGERWGCDEGGGSNSILTTGKGWTNACK